MDGYYFNVGDALGFSVSMSGEGDKLAIGVPLYSDCNTIFGANFSDKE